MNTVHHPLIYAFLTSFILTSFNSSHLRQRQIMRRIMSQRMAADGGGFSRLNKWTIR